MCDAKSNASLSEDPCFYGTRLGKMIEKAAVAELQEDVVEHQLCAFLVRGYLQLANMTVSHFRDLDVFFAHEHQIAPIFTLSYIID